MCDGRIWDRVDEISETFIIGDVVIIKGQVQFYQSRKQIIIHKIEKASEDQYVKDDFQIDMVHIDAHGLYSELIALVSTLESPPIKQILLDSLQDEEIKKLILKGVT